MKKLILILLLAPCAIQAQNYALQINGSAKITMSGAVWININQPNVLGITRTVSTGGIICDNEQSRVNWMIGTGTGNYVFPLMSVDGDNATAEVNVTAAGTGAGSLVVSTYHTPVNNMPYPQNSDAWFTDVTNMWDVNGVDNSNNAVDRFWMILYNGYATNPTATLTLKYDAIGTSDLNGILESDLQAEFWNGATWAPYSPLLGVADPANDQVNTITGVNFNAPWVLSNRTNPLPVELLSLSYTCGELNWTTASETDCDRYENPGLSENGDDWSLLGQRDGSGNSSQVLSYTYPTDLKNVYFKLIQYDYDGSYATYGPVWGACGEGQPEISIQVYPNPFNEVIYVVCPQDCTMEIFDAKGKLVRTEKMQAFNTIEMDGLANGLYTLNFKGDGFFDSHKVVKNKH